MLRLFVFFYISCCSMVAFAGDLVTVDWLENNLSKVKVIDLREAEHYQAGHIPQAINIPYKLLNREKNGVEGFVITPGQFQKVMQKHGIQNSDTLVLYGDWSFLYSMRVYWILDFYAHKKTKVLDGGMQAWLSSNKPLSIDSMSIQLSQYIVNVNPEVLSTKLRTFMATKNDQYVIVDARSSDQFSGKESLTQRYGHIPSAINFPWVDLINNRKEEDGFKKLQVPSTLKDLTELQQKLAIIPLDKKVIVYCNGGQESSVIYFAMKELGRKASLYDGSWFEWSEDHVLPVE